jgi:glycosidase
LCARRISRPPRPDRQTSDLWWKNGVVYCLDVETFADSDGDGCGDLAGLVERIDHVANLGATCLWLMPLYPSTHRDDGYDITDYLGVDARMAWSLLLTLPGTPVILYGDEIGMGEDLNLDGRMSVRTPMQWSPGPSAGFSTASPARAPDRRGRVRPGSGERRRSAAQ